MYLQGDFISKHDDGIVENRFCVVLIPMNNRPDEVDKFTCSGGDLILYPDSDNVGIQVESKLGDIVILDFNHNNVKHEVTPVDKWIRYSLVGFLFKK